MILTVAVIALLFAGALFAVGFAVVDRGDDMSRRLAELDPFPAENARNDKIVTSLVDAKQQVLLSGRFAEAGWYKTTVLSFTFARLGGATGLAAGGALGSVARDLAGGKEHVIALAGDAAFTNGIFLTATNISTCESRPAMARTIWSQVRVVRSSEIPLPRTQGVNNTRLMKF